MTFFNIALPLILLMPLTSQDTRIVTGTVRNQDGRSLVGAIVQMVNMDSQQVWSNVTKSDGTYRFAAVEFAQGYRLHSRMPLQRDTRIVGPSEESPRNSPPPEAS